MGRKEIEFEVREQATPSRSDVRRDIAVIMKTDLDKVWVRKIETKAGTNVTVGLAHVYDDSEKALKVEPEHIVKRNQATSTSTEDSTEEEKSEEGPT
jgi:ribosomal protein S24E